MADTPTPISRPQRATTAEQMGSARTQTGISPSTAGRIVRPSIGVPRERIMLLGDTVSGKTYAELKLAERKMNEAIAEEKPVPKFYVIDTDDALSTMLGPGCEFEHLYFDNGGNVYPYTCFSYDEIREALGSIIKNEKPLRHDWVCIDVINRVYERAQDLVASVRNKNLDDAAFQRMREGKGFGAFEPNDWNLVNRAYNTIQNTLAFQMQANILLCCHIKPIIDVEGWERRENLALFDAIGMRPEGSSRAVGTMDTAIAIWAKRIIRREGNRRVGQAQTVRYMWVAKDRGRGIVSDRMTFDTDMWETFYDYRTTSPKSANITDPKSVAAFEREADDYQGDEDADTG